MSSKVTLSKPIIIMMYGFPGSGKTSFARQISDELGMIHLQQDRIIQDLLGAHSGPNAAKVSRKIMDFMANDFLRAGISLVYDASVIRASDRKIVREMAHAAKAESLLIWLQVDPETTFSRVEKRDKRKADDRYAREYNEDEYRSILSHMQNPNHEKYVVVSGKHTFKSQRSSVMKKLFDMKVISSDDATQKVVKPELMSIVPKTEIKGRGDIIQRNISIR